MKGMNMDADKSASGTGVPAGYTGVTDHADAKITDAKYTSNGGRWEIQTGPAHITFAAKDSAKGQYQVSTTIEQLEKPKHPGGVRGLPGRHESHGSGQAEVRLLRGSRHGRVSHQDPRRREHDDRSWTGRRIPRFRRKTRAERRRTRSTVHVAPDTVHFIVDGNLVAAVPKSKFPTDGIAGIRVNHNLHVAVTPLVISK